MAEAIQVIASVTELVRVSYQLYQFFKRVKGADQNAKESYLRIKQLHEVVYGVEFALKIRETQVGNKPVKGEKAVWGYIKTSVVRAHNVLLRIKIMFTPFNIEADEKPAGLVSKAIRQIRFDVKKDDLACLFANLDTQLQALQVNLQTLNTFISMGTTDRVDTSKDEILDAIARLTKLHREGHSKLDTLMKKQEHAEPPSLNRVRMPSIDFTQVSNSQGKIIRPDDGPDDIETMKGTLDAALDVISTADFPEQSVADRLELLNLDDADSGFGSDDDNDGDSSLLAQAMMAGQKAGDRPPPRRKGNFRVKHIHEHTQNELDSLITKYQDRVEGALAKDQVHTAEADLRQLMFYAHERQEKFNVHFDRVQMSELLVAIYKKQGNHDDVFAVLAELLPNENSAEEHTLSNSRHFYMAAETYYERWTTKNQPDDLDEALDYARSAFTIRRAELAPDNEDLHESAKLLADIYEALNRPVEAEVYRGLVPVTEPAPTVPPHSPRPETLTSIETGDIELEADVDVNKSLLPTIKAGNVGMLRALLRSEDLDLDQRYGHGATPLMYAFRYSKGDESMPLALIEQNADIDAFDNDRRTVLHQAAARADVAMIQLAIRRDASKDLKDKDLLTPLLIAVKESYKSQRYRAAVEALLDEKCDFKAKDKEGWTVLHFAAHNAATGAGSTAKTFAKNVLDLLLTRLPQDFINTLDRNQYTPLLRIAGSGNVDTVGALLDAGADPNLRNKANSSALSLAMLKKPDKPEFASVIKRLVEAGATVAEDEPSREDYKRFRHLLFPASANGPGLRGHMRRASEQSRRWSDSKASINKVERVDSTGTMDSSFGAGQSEAGSEQGSTQKRRIGLGLFRRS